jgi:hypothetical protein
VWLDGALVGGVLLNGSDSDYHTVEGEYPHPDYTPGPEDNDIMLVKLSEPAIRPLVTLNFDSVVTVTGEPLTIIGLGNTEEDGTISEELLEATVNAVSYETCNDYYQTIINDIMLCAGVPDGSRDSCQVRLLSLLCWYEGSAYCISSLLCAYCAVDHFVLETSVLVGSSTG